MSANKEVFLKMWCNLINGVTPFSLLFRNLFPKIENLSISGNIRQKYNIKNLALMDRIPQFLMDNVSNLTSAKSITDTLTSNKDKINHKTVGNYLNYLCNAFAFYKFRRYDIKGRKYLASGSGQISGQTVRHKPNGINCLICRITLCVLP